jgi:hypothetical protein
MGAAAVPAALSFTADTAARIAPMTSTMPAILADTAEMKQVKRLTEFAADVLDLADDRRDFELRELVNELHFDLTRLEGDDDG